jgi:EmrB/QacA subfamily drug resistance transporter
MSLTDLLSPRRRSDGTRPPSSAGSANTNAARRWWILALLGVAQLMVVLDVTIVNIALPSAQKALGFSNANRQWVLTAYTLAFGGLLLLGGRLSDVLGRKRTLLIGLIGFALASALGGASVDFVMLVAARAVQGAFAALLAPSALSLLTTTFSDPAERGKAFGIYGGIAAGGAAIGLLLGGALTQYLNWRYTLFVNVVFAVGAGIGAVVLLANTPPADHPHYDIPGATTVVSGLAVLVYGLSEAERRGWSDPLTLGLILGGGVLLVVFVWIESRVDRPLLPLDMVAHRNRIGPYLAVFVVAITTFGLFLFLTFYLQQTLGYSPLKTGVAYLPMVGFLMTTSIISNEVLLRRVGPRPLISAGLVLAAGGVTLLTRLGLHSSYPTGLLPGLVIIGAGLGVVFSSALNTATSGLAPTHAGVGSAVVTTSQQIGASVGIALLNTIAASATSSYLRGKTPTKQVVALAAVHGENVAFAVVVGILLGGAIVCGLVIANINVRSGTTVPAG